MKTVARVVLIFFDFSTSSSREALGHKWTTTRIDFVQLVVASCRTTFEVTLQSVPFLFSLKQSI